MIKGLHTFQGFYYKCIHFIIKSKCNSLASDPQFIMDPKIWATSDNGNIEFTSVTSDKLEEIMNIMRDSYLVNENVASAIELSKDPVATADMMEYFDELLFEGCSIVALDKETRAVAGVAINKILDQSTRLKDIEEMKVFEAECESPAMKAMMEFANCMGDSYDLYTHCNVDCVMEITFLATAPLYRGQGIAKKLSEASIDLAKRLKAGENVKTPLDEEELPLEPIPEVVFSIFTSFITQKIGKSLGFHEITRKSLDTWSYKGKTLAEMIDPQTSYVSVEYLKI